MLPHKATPMHAAYAVLQQGVAIQDGQAEAQRRATKFYDTLVSRGLVLPFIRACQPAVKPA